jgi:RluA family pseudouridine synthase
MPEFKKVPKRYQPKGFDILYEDRDVIVGNKAPGFLTVSAKWNRENTVHSALNSYVRKGNSKSRKVVYVVHRLDQDTSGVLIFAKTPESQAFLKDHWQDTKKAYYAVVHGRLAQKTGILSSYLVEDDEYVMHSTENSREGKLAHTAYSVIKETDKFSLVKIDLLTGRKNQIRVHFADAGHPLVGDEKYGRSDTRHRRLALHAQAISFLHPFHRKRMNFETDIPEYFHTLMGR